MPCAFPRQNVTGQIDSEALTLLAPGTTAQERKRADEIEVADEKALRDRREKWKSQGGGWGMRKKPKPKKATKDTGKDEAALMSVGDRVTVGAKGEGTIRYVGTIENLPLGFWIGIELDEREGKHDGEVKGTRIFQCEPGHGLCVRPKRVRGCVRVSILKYCKDKMLFESLPNNEIF